MSVKERKLRKHAKYIDLVKKASRRNKRKCTICKQKINCANYYFCSKCHASKREYLMECLYVR